MHKKKNRNNRIQEESDKLKFNFNNVNLETMTNLVT